MSGKKVLVTYGIILILMGLPFAVLHLRYNPDDAPISPLQMMVAVLANYFGPWGVAIVRMVDFPNAGMRMFSWVLAIGMTLAAAALVAIPLCVRRPWVQYSCVLLWVLLMFVWCGVGFRQIAGGLL